MRPGCRRLNQDDIKFDWKSVGGSWAMNRVRKSETGDEGAPSMYIMGGIRLRHSVAHCIYPRRIASNTLFPVTDDLLLQATRGGNIKNAVFLGCISVTALDEMSPPKKWIIDPLLYSIKSAENTSKNLPTALITNSTNDTQKNVLNSTKTIHNLKYDAEHIPTSQVPSPAQVHGSRSDEAGTGGAL